MSSFSHAFGLGTLSGARVFADAAALRLACSTGAWEQYHVSSPFPLRLIWVRRAWFGRGAIADMAVWPLACTTGVGEQSGVSSFPPSSPCPAPPPQFLSAVDLGALSGANTC